MASFPHVGYLFSILEIMCYGNIKNVKIHFVACDSLCTECRHRNQDEERLHEASSI